MNDFRDPEEVRELVKRCQQRPVLEDDWSKLWSRIHPFVCWRVWHMMNATAQREMDDTVQDIFLKLFNSLPGYDPERAPLLTYLNYIVSSVIYDRWRREEKEKDTTAPLETEVLRLAERVGAATPGDVLADAAGRIVESITDPLKLAIVRDLMDGVDVQVICERHRVKQYFVYGVRRECIERVREVLAGLNPSGN
jgi:RNA polymerase sigma factor (sigma-70 family)